MFVSRAKCQACHIAHGRLRVLKACIAIHEKGGRPAYHAVVGMVDKLVRPNVCLGSRAVYDQEWRQIVLLAVHEVSLQFLRDVVQSAAVEASSHLHPRPQTVRYCESTSRLNTLEYAHALSSERHTLASA